MHACINVCRHACMRGIYVRLYECMHECTHACTYVRLHECMHECTHIRAHATAASTNTPPHAKPYRPAPHRPDTAAARCRDHDNQEKQPRLLTRPAGRSLAPN